MESGQLHPPPQARHIKQSIEGGSEFSVFEKRFQVPHPAATKASPPPRFEAEVALEVIVTDLTVDLAVRRNFLIGVLLNQTLLDVWRQV